MQFRLDLAGIAPPRSLLDVSLCHIPYLGQSWDIMSMRLLTAIQKLLQGLVILGLVLAPVAASAHGGMGHAPSMATMLDDGTPCCPEQSSGDCQQCAITAPCMAKCLQNIASEATYSPLPQPITMKSPILISADPLVGLEYAPPQRPPRS